MNANPLVDVLTLHGLQLLKSPSMINDELSIADLAQCRAVMHVSQHFLLDKLSQSFSNGEYNAQEFRRWFTEHRLRHLNKRWYEHTHIFFPIHKGLHWISAALHLQQKVLACYDPLGVSVVNTLLLCLLTSCIN